MTDKQIPRKRFAALIPPMLAPNKLLSMDIDITEELFPCLASTKYNGIRGLAINRRWISRSGKELVLHPLLAAQYQPILDYAGKHELVLDGEFNSNTCNTVGQTRSILAGKLPTPEDFLFKCFYTVPYSVWNGAVPATMSDLLAWDIPIRHYYRVTQIQLHYADDFISMIAEHKHRNIEGFMLLNPLGTYKHGRVTQTEATLLKYKYYTGEEDAKIVNLTPRRERRSGILSGETPLGYAQQPYSQGSFQDTDIAGCLVCQIEGKGDIIYAPFPVGWGLEDRRRAYLAKGSGEADDLIGQWICFRRLACESRDKPISIKGVQLRDSKD